jgi:hypothetical protein
MITPKQDLYNNNYIILNNFIDEDRAKELYEVFRQTTIEYPEIFSGDTQSKFSPCINNYKYFLELLVEKTPLITELMEEPMLPTYSYARLYKHGEVLEKHIDRPACEISMTVHLGSDGTEWPIWFTRPNGEAVSVNLKPGQAAMYLGCVSPHWRDEFKGQEYGQVFIHYVRSRGEFWDHYFDKNPDKFNKNKV